MNYSHLHEIVKKENGEAGSGAPPPAMTGVGRRGDPGIKKD
jgi:hypothetical protein